MNAIQALLTDNLDLWTSALLAKSTAGRGSNGKLEAYGIKKLRELILELAVQGKLVPQDANDEPASVLLEKIAKEKAQLIGKGKIKNSDVLPEIFDDEKTYSAPKTWVWSRLGCLFEIVYGKGLPTSKFTEEGYDVFGANGVIGKYSEFTFEESQLLISCRGAYSGKANLSPPKCFITSNTLILQNSWEHLDLQYFYYTLSIADKSKIVTGSAQPQVTTTNLSPFVIAIPPLAEQHRIVAKVDELMALCDQLEQQQTHSLAAHQTLIETLLGTLTHVESPQEFITAWARIASHFDTLFTTEASIAQLKQTLLQLAVMGKLVPQDPDDEPANVLLQRIATEKAQLINEGRISKPKPLPPVTEEEKQFDIPDGWVWTRFDDLALHSEAGWSPSCEPTPRQGDSWGILKVSAVTWGKYDPHENKALPANLEPKPEFEVMPGDFLISRANTAELVARAVVVPNGVPPRLMMSDKIIRFVFTPELDHEYLALVNGCELSRAYYARVAGGTSSSMKNVSREQIRNLVVALPPLAEQHRIVAKVDELMTLCDALKARIKDAQTIQLHLADAIVEQAVC